MTSQPAEAVRAGNELDLGKVALNVGSIGGLLAVVAWAVARLAENPDYFIAAVLIGISNGALIALVALGYTLVYGIIGLINFSHGDLFMLGTAISLFTLQRLGYGPEPGLSGAPWLGILIAGLLRRAIAGTFNVLPERFASRRRGGAAAVLYGLFFNNTQFQLGFPAGLQAFTAAVLGGIGNVRGAALGGIVIGILASLTVTYAGGQWANVGVFTVLVIVLVFRPSGLLGEETPER